MVLILAIIAARVLASYEAAYIDQTGAACVVFAAGNDHGVDVCYGRIDR